MAERPIFIPVLEGPLLVATQWCEFQWFPGFMLSQKRKSIAALHATAKARLGLSRLQEVSPKAEDADGVALSGFHLLLPLDEGEESVPVECAYQAGKVFENGGPFRDLLRADPVDLKRDERLVHSGALIAYRHGGGDWPLSPQTAFYDWLYLSALRDSPDLADRLAQRDAFTDIEFTPERGPQCAAYAAALYVSLVRRNQLDVATASPEAFLKFLQGRPTSHARAPSHGRPARAAAS